MTSWPDEVKASVYSQINFVNSSRLLLLEHVRLVLVVKKFYDGHPGVTIVHVVSKAGGINDSQADWLKH
jgi:hypothetical protein